jgi:hypothetical protein
LSNIFVIGEGAKPLVSLPKGKGVKLSIAGAFSRDVCCFFFVGRVVLTSRFGFAYYQRSVISAVVSRPRRHKLQAVFFSSSQRPDCP